MATELNLDCMENILKFLTPQDWICVSEVCTWWKTAANEMWKKMNAFKFTHKVERNQNYEGITSEEAQRMVFQVAPFIEFLSTDLNTKPLFDDHFKFLIHIKSPSKSFFYKVILPDGTPTRFDRKYFNEMVKLFADNASELTKVEFHHRYVPPARTLKVLFSENNITTVSVEIVGLRAICRNNLTDKIQELNIRLFEHAVYYAIPFKGHFPNLQKLNLCVLDNKKEFAIQGNIQGPYLVSTLPYATGLKSLNVELPGTLFLDANVDFATHEMENILKMTKLEELVLSFSLFEFSNVDSFIQKLTKTLLELRVVHFCNIPLSNSAISTLMSLPKVESLFLQPQSDFNPTNIPEMVHLSKLFISFDKMRSNEPVEKHTTAISNMIRQMPKLKLLEMRDFEEGHGIIAIAIAAAVSQNKEVLITAYIKDLCRFSRQYGAYTHVSDIKIGGKDDSDIGSGTLNIILIYDHTALTKFIGVI